MGCIHHLQFDSSLNVEGAGGTGGTGGIAASSTVSTAAMQVTSIHYLGTASSIQSTAGILLKEYRHGDFAIATTRGGIVALLDLVSIIISFNFATYSYLAW